MFHPMSARETSEVMALLSDMLAAQHAEKAQEARVRTD
jgi:hypothetical protein